VKFILLLVVAVVVLWLARRALRRVRGQEAAPPPLPTPEQMVACRECGLNIPFGDAVSGPGGVFCTEAHRAAFEQAQR
jgi:uncharacterized protein